ncbi:hypothetical protein FACS18949_00070 [Clostridia bacterium]|nr:hypothetical protein FACS18949_00070 [Clostridia bacterium]
MAKRKRKKYGFLTYEDRLKIQRWRSENVTPIIMAEKLGRNRATIYRELKRGRTDELDKNLNYKYDALLAHQRYQESFVCRGRKKVVKI